MALACVRSSVIWHLPLPGLALAPAGRQAPPCRSSAGTKVHLNYSQTCTGGARRRIWPTICCQKAKWDLFDPTCPQEHPEDKSRWIAVLGRTCLILGLGIKFPNLRQVNSGWRRLRYAVSCLFFLSPLPHRQLRLFDRQVHGLCRDRYQQKPASKVCMWNNGITKPFTPPYSSSSSFIISSSYFDLRA